MQRLSALLLVCAAGLATQGRADAHARLLVPLNRLGTTGDMNGGITTAPCGASTKSATPVTYKPGQQITVTIQETIDHIGHYELHWSNDNDATFPVITGQDNIANPTGVENTTVQLTLPSTPCDNCTLQMVMVQTNVPAVSYYSCTDVRLSNNPAVSDDAGVEDMASAASDLGVTLTGDASATIAGDMEHRPKSAAASLPGCSVVSAHAPPLVGIVLVLGAMLLGALRRKRVLVATARRTDRRSR